MNQTQTLNKSSDQSWHCCLARYSELRESPLEILAQQYPQMLPPRLRDSKDLDWKPRVKCLHVVDMWHHSSCPVAHDDVACVGNIATLVHFVAMDAQTYS
ncbi:hypothetical protein AAC387_Pa03g1681 [Persea americana]